MTDRVIALGESDFGSAVSSGVWVVEYYRPGCAPCHAMFPVLEELADGSAGVAVGKVDVDAAPALAERAGIAGVPTLEIFRDGESVRVLRGPKNRRQILAALESTALDTREVEQENSASN